MALRKRGEHCGLLAIPGYLFIYVSLLFLIPQPSSNEFAGRFAHGKVSKRNDEMLTLSDTVKPVRELSSRGQELSCAGSCPS